MRPVCRIEVVCPRDRASLLIVVPLGIWRPGWPSHCVEGCGGMGSLACDEVAALLLSELRGLNRPTDRPAREWMNG